LHGNSWEKIKNAIPKLSPSEYKEKYKVFEKKGLLDNKAIDRKKTKEQSSSIKHKLDENDELDVKDIK